VRALVDLIERTLVTTLAGYGIEAAADPAAPGVYVAGAKIASLGLRVRRGCSYHGLALNVAMDLEPFRRINPCGYPGLAVTSLEEQLGAACPGLEEVGECLLATLLAELADPARPPRR
jgi:lipoyl(octanoyl) transferase